MPANNEIIESNEEINLFQLIQRLWNERRIIIILVFIFAIFGIFVAVNKNNVYTASTSFIPKDSQSKSSVGGLSSLASMAGINLGNISSVNSEIPSNLYPRFVKSIPFIDILLETVLPSTDKKINLKQYLSKESNNSFFSTLKKYTIQLPPLILSNILKKEEFKPVNGESSAIRHFSLEEENLYKKVKDLINISVDNNMGFITLSVQDENPEIAALIAMSAQNLLQQEVINFKIKNAQELLAFTENLYEKKKKEFEAVQDELANFRDQHQNISSGLFRNKESRLVAEYDITSAVYQELAKQVEQARIQVSKDTPIFTIIDPVVIPNQRTSPKRKLIVLGYAFFGFCIGIFYALFKKPFITIRKRLFENT